MHDMTARQTGILWPQKRSSGPADSLKILGDGNACGETLPRPENYRKQTWRHGQYQFSCPFPQSGSIPTMANEQKSLLARLHAKPDKVEEVRTFLEDALPLAEDEEKTVSWYALQIDDTTFGIFDTFAGEEGRQAHLDGDIAAALMEHADELLEEPPQIEHVDVLAAK